MSRINLTKKDLINSIYMQIGFSKKISENLIDDFLITIIDNLKKEKKIISDRNVVLFKASKEFKDLVNIKNDA
jgi:integration host factor subunit alpha